MFVTGWSRGSFPRLIYKDVTTKPCLNSNLITGGKTSGIDDIAILIVVYRRSVKGSRKWIPRYKGREGNVRLS